MRLLDIDEIAELVVSILAARHVAAFARASSHCAALAKRALEFDGPRGAEVALRLAEGRGVDELCQRWPVLVLPRLGSPPLVGALATIGDRAFYGCSSLTTITLPAGLATIGGHAFSGCSSLTTVTLPAGLTTIGDFAFYGCSSLTTIILPAGLATIGGGAFAGCSSLTTITLPAGLTTIGDCAFAGCSSLTTINLPAGLATIGGYAFYGCRALDEETVARLAFLGFDLMVAD